MADPIDRGPDYHGHELSGQELSLPARFRLRAQQQAGQEVPVDEFEDIRKRMEDLEAQHPHEELELNIPGNPTQGLVNVDYVVDSTGRGTHKLLHTPLGALAEAIAAGANTTRTIWLCSTHTETVTSIETITLGANQKIAIISGGRNRPTMTVGAGLGANPVYRFSSNAGAGALLRMSGFNWSRPVAATANPLMDVISGAQMPDVELFDIAFDGATGQWTDILNMNTVGSGTMRDLILEFITGVVGIDKIVNISSAASTTGKFVLRRSQFVSLGQVFFRNNATDVDPGIDGIIIDNNYFEVLTGYLIQRTFDYPLQITNNDIKEFSAAAACIQIGTTGTTSPTDAVVANNNIYCSAVGAVAVDIDGGAGTAENIAVVGNSFRGPGSGVAVRLDIANNDCIIANAYRDWTTTVGGSVGPGTGTAVGAHALLSTTHTDTLAASVVRGDLVVGNATPAWARLATGAAGSVLRSNGTDPAWTINPTIAGYLRLGATAAPTNTTAGDLTCVRLIIPDHALVARLLDVQDTYTATLGGGAQITASIGSIVTVAAGAATDELRGQSVQIEPRPTANYAGGVYGQYLRIVHDTGAFNINDARVSYQQLVQNLAGTTITTGHGLLVSYRAQAGTITTAYGLLVERGASGDAGAIGTGIGIEVRASSGVTPTTDIAIRTLGGQHRFVGHTMLGADVAPVASLEVRGAIDSAAALGLANLRLGSLSGDGAIIWEGSSGGMWDARNNAGTLKWGRTGSSFDVDFETTGVEIANSLRVGALTAPTNTTAGDLTCIRLFVGDAAAVAGVEALITGDLSVSGAGVFGVAAAVTNASVALEVQSTTQAFLASRMTTVQRDAMTPLNGMIIYNTTTATLQGYQAGAWTNL